MADFTIIIPTYNRPELLKYAIKSVIAQTHKGWKLLVVGDACAPETREAVDSFDDPRIYYVNLTARCGEQSGPNSAGISAADTPYIAILNHDDLWLPDHLEVALGALKRADADLFLGAAGFTTFATNLEGEQFPAFNGVSPAERHLEQAHYHKMPLFEPVSSWVFTRKLAYRVGQWKPAGLLERTPLEDWILRAWRADASLVTGTEPTVIYCNAEKRKWVKQRESERAAMYDLPAEEQAYWWQKLEAHGAGWMRARIERDLGKISRKPDYFGHRSDGDPAGDIMAALLTPATAQLYKEHGWDAIGPAFRLAGRDKGASLEFMLERRTGETLPSVRNWHGPIREVQQALRQMPAWAEKGR